MVIFKTQNRRQKKNLTASYKTQIKILHFPGLAELGSEQPGPGATLLGWPKSIYCILLTIHMYKLQDVLAVMYCHP